MSDMTDHLTQFSWPALVILHGVPPTITIASEMSVHVVPSNTINMYIDYTKFEKQ